MLPLDDVEALWESGLQSESIGDFRGAEIYYLQAAERGHSMAQINLGNILDDYSVPRDPNGAVYWYTEAWKHGESSAAWNLYVHYNKSGSSAQASLWKNRAADMGHPDALMERDQI